MLLPFDRPNGHVALALTLSLRTRNPLNGGTGDTKLAQIIRSQERARHRKVARADVLEAMRLNGLCALDLVPAVVKLTRVSAGHMDDDGLAAALKGVRDGIAQALGVDDGGRFIQFVYGQHKGPKKQYAVDVLIARVS
jgi:hypothetical protein